METVQLYESGRELCPRTNYENDGAPQKIQQMEAFLDELAARVAAALAEAKSYADGTYMQASGYTDLKVADLINGAPTTLDTLKEIADAMLENESVVQALEAAVGAKANEVEFQAHTGNGTTHVTAGEREKWNGAKTSADSACQRLDEMDAEVARIKTNFQDGCNAVAGKITACGVSTPENASPGTMAENIQKIYDARYSAGVSAARAGNATAAQVLDGFTFTNTKGSGITGTMPNQGAVSKALNCGGSYTIPKGYHNGSGKVAANTLASQTSATASAANITKGKTAWVNGVKVTGTGADNTTNYNNGYNAAASENYMLIKEVLYQINGGETYITFDTSNYKTIKIGSRSSGGGTMEIYGNSTVIGNAVGTQYNIASYSTVKIRLSNATYVSGRLYNVELN